MSTESAAAPRLEGPNKYGLLTIDSTDRDDATPLLQTKSAVELALDLTPGELSDTHINTGKNRIESRIRAITIEDRPLTRSTFDPYLQDLVVIPITWFTTITRTRKNSKVPKAYNEAIHLLGYILYKYQRATRIPGALLALESAFLSERFGMSVYTLRTAIRYLGSEGYIYRILYRGYVPWKPRKSRTFLFVVPRMKKIEEASRGDEGVGIPPY